MSVEAYPWRNGYWQDKNTSLMIFVIDGENALAKHLTCLDYPDSKPFGLFNGKITYGDFGPAPKELSDPSGVNNCALQWEIPALNIKMPCVVSNEGKRIHKFSFVASGVQTLEWMDEGQLEELKKSREPLDAPTLPSYITPRPENEGKLIWLSGPPGVGKSTSAQLMARSHGYVYYEVDCLLNALNPFVDIHEDNPLANIRSQKPLKIDQPDVFKATQDFMGDIEKIKKGELDDLSFMKSNDAKMAVGRHIIQQRKRIGGDWAIAFACASRQSREALPELFGPTLVFIVMGMTKECAQKRLGSRHGGSAGKNIGGMLEKIYSMYDNVGDDEENAYSVTVDENMSKEDVIDKILKIVENV